MKQLLLQLVLILVNAIFAATEIALISVNDAKLEHLAAGGNKKAKKLLALIRQPARFLATIQVGITLAGFLASAFAANNFASALAGRLAALGVPAQPQALETASVVAITIILAFFTLVLGELVPKRIAMKKAEPLAFFMADFIFLVSRIFAPLVWLLTRATNALLRLFRLYPNAEDETVTEEEIRLMVDAGSEKGAINAGEQEIIHNVFEFDDRTASEVMTHRTNAVLLREKDSDDEWRNIITENRHACYPVIGGTFDDVKGILSSNDYFRLKSHDRKTVMEGAVFPPNFVPETAKTDVLFKKMKQSRNHFAVVLDEYGGVSGIITINDLLEAIVGDFDDQPPALALIEKLDGDRWRVSGAIPPVRVERALKTALDGSGDYDTFGGYVFSLMGEIPADGNTAEVDGGDIVITVEKIQDRRPVSALVRKKPTLETEG